MVKQLPRITYSASTAWFFCANYCLRAGPQVETGSRQDWLLNDMTLSIYNGGHLSSLRDGDLFGSLSANGVGCSAGYLEFAKQLMQHLRRTRQDRITPFVGLQMINSHEWPVQLFDPERRGAFALVSTKQFEEICGRRLRIPPPR